VRKINTDWRENRSKHPALKLENQICHSLYSATNALVRAYRPLLENLELTYPQYLVMLALWDEDKVIIKDLVQRTRFDAGTLTPVLKRLESKQLVSIGKSSTDSRQKIVLLSQQGRDLENRAKEVPEALSCQIEMPSHDALQLKALAEQLYALIGSQDKPTSVKGSE
jgi:DNA-binding MarR family transcriptional regulator